MNLIKTDWFLQKARTDWDWEADRLGGLQQFRRRFCKQTQLRGRKANMESEILAFSDGDGTAQWGQYFHIHTQLFLQQTQNQQRRR